MKLDAHGLKVLKLWGGVAVIGFVANVAYSHIGASNYRRNAEQQIAKCELKGMDTHTMGMKLTLAERCEDLFWGQKTDSMRSTQRFSESLASHIERHSRKLLIHAYSHI